MTRLHQAAEHGDAAYLKTLIEEGDDIEAVDAEGCTPLHIAAWFNQADTVDMLVHMGANVSAKEGHGRTALYAACRNAALQAAEVLLLKSGADPSSKAQQDEKGENSLHAAIRSNNPDILPLFRSHFTDLCVADDSGKNPLHTGVSNGCFKTLSEVLTWKPFPATALNEQDKSGDTPLTLAVRLFDEQAALLFLNMEAIDTKPLQWTNGHESIFFNTKKDTKIDPLSRYLSSGTSLHLAAGLGRTSILQEIFDEAGELKLSRIEEKYREVQSGLESGKGILSGTDSNKVSDLIEELKWDYTKCLEATDDSGRTPLHIAAHCGHHNTVEMLVNLGSNVNSVDSYGWTALHFASDGNFVKIVTFLISSGACPDQDLLTIAAGKGHQETLSILFTYQSLQVPPEACIQAIANSHNAALQLLLPRLDQYHITAPCSASPAGPLGFALSIGNLPAVESLLSLSPTLCSDLFLETVRSKNLSETKKSQILYFLLRHLSPSISAVSECAYLGLESCLEILLESLDAAKTNKPQSGALPCLNMTDVTPLQSALFGKRYGSVRIILSAGVDPNLAGTGLDPPLILAIREAGEKEVKALLQAGCSPNEALSCETGLRFTISSLAEAVLKGSETICKRLYKRGAVVDSESGAGNPLLIACREKKWGLARLLLTYNAPVNVYDCDSPEGDVGPIFYALKGLTARVSFGFIMDVIERLCPPPEKNSEDLSFTILQATGTQTGLRTIKDLFSPAAAMVSQHAGYRFSNTHVCGTPEVQQTLIRCCKQLEAILFVGSRQQAITVMKNLSSDRPRGRCRSGGAADRRESLVPVKKRVFILYRAEEDLRCFNGLY